MLGEDILGLVGERAEMAGLALKVEVSNDLPALYTDERRVKQILLNLLTNAINFTQTSGNVTLKAGVDGDNRFVFTVSDTGQDIAPENLDLVMTPFRQEDETMTRAHDGAGLGLPLASPWPTSTALNWPWIASLTWALQ